MVTLAPAGTVIVFLSKAKLCEMTSIVTLSAGTPGVEGVDVGVEVGVGVGIEVGVVGCVEIGDDEGTDRVTVVVLDEQANKPDISASPITISKTLPQRRIALFILSLLNR
jgi:hypothetical protein